MFKPVLRYFAFAVSIALLLVVLKAVNWVPGVVEEGLLKPYASLDEVKQKLHVREVYVPSYFPQRLRWPPARILAQSKPHVAVAMEFVDREKGDVALMISQSTSADLVPDRKLEIREIRQTLPYRLQGRDAVLQVGTCNDGDTCSRISWGEGTYRMLVAMRSVPSDLLLIVHSMIE